MRHTAFLASGVALLAAIGTLNAQNRRSNAWRDATKHTVQFVMVDKGVRLELLDWGGAGRPVLLLTGSGHTAHVYDEFAPKLIDCCHLYGITRRGYGESARPTTGYDDQRLADDVLAAIDGAKLQRPILIGHSMAGAEMTTLARNHSDRVSALVYMDALGDLEDDPAADPDWSALQKKAPSDLRPQPVCDPVDRSSFTAYQKSMACRLGFTIPQSELRNQFADIDGSVGSAKTPDWVSRAIGQQQVYRRDYSNIKVPVLAFLEFPKWPEDYKPKTEEDRAIVEQFVERGRVLVGRWTGKLKQHVRDATFVDVPGGGHYLWLKRQDLVLREIHSFIASLPSAP
jgi:pimeloyl-ACP methyl ester carboxylesterase